MLREYLLGLSLIEYTIIHSAPLQEMCGARKVPVLSLRREVKQALFFISKTQSGPVDKVLTTDVFYVIIGKTDKGWGLCS